MSQSGDQYRKKNRIRLQRYYKKQAAAGKKRVSALVSEDVHHLLMDEKKKRGSSLSSLIENSVMLAYGDPAKNFSRRLNLDVSKVTKTDGGLTFVTIGRSPSDDDSK